MSSQQNDTLYESALERFWDCMFMPDFDYLIYSNFLSSTDQCKQKEFGFNQDPYNDAFDLCWQWDAEGMSQDVEGTIKKYIEANK